MSVTIHYPGLKIKDRNLNKLILVCGNKGSRDNDIRFFNIDDQFSYSYITVHYPKNIKTLSEFMITIIIKQNNSRLPFQLFNTMLDGNFFHGKGIFC